MRLPVPTERAEQVALFEWATAMTPTHPELDLLFHIPNSGGLSTGHTSATFARVSSLLKQGLKPGVPDLFLPVARRGFHGLFVEMKRRRGAKVSPQQRDRADRLTAQGYLVRICPGWDAARADLCHYLGI